MREPGTLEIALAAFAMFFATVGPVDSAVIFAGLTSRQPRSLRSLISGRFAR